MKSECYFRWFALLAILLLSSLVLIHNLDKTSLWADEGWTIAATAVDNPIAVIDEWVEEDVHPPLFFMGLNIWRQFTGDTIFEMRYYSILMTLIGVALMYRLGKAMFSTRAGLLAALFFGLHDLVNVLTQEVRHYPQQQTATILAMWLYWRFWQRPTRNRGIVFAMGGAVLIWSHYWGVFVLMALGLHALITRWQNIRPYIAANLGIALLYVPWLPVLYGQITTERPEGLPHALENSWTVYKTLAFQLVGIPEILWLVLAAAGTLGALHAVHSSGWRPTPASILPAMIIVITIGLSLLINTQYATLSFRSLAVVIPPLAILVAHTLAQFRRAELRVMVIFLIIHSLATTSARPVERPPWPEMADFVEAHQNGLVLLEMDTDDHAFAYYLDNVNYISTETKRKSDPTRFSDFLTQTLADKDGLWLVKFGYFAYDIRLDLQEQGFVNSLPPIEWGQYVDGRPIELWRFDRPGEEPGVTFDDVMGLMRDDMRVDGQQVTISLLWSALQTPERNYTVSTFLLQPGQPLADQHDSYPFNGRSPTLDWQVGGIYFDQHHLSAPPGRYLVGVKVYYFVDTDFTQLEIVPASDCSAHEACEFIFIDEIEIP